MKVTRTAFSLGLIMKPVCVAPVCCEENKRTEKEAAGTFGIAEDHMVHGDFKALLA